MRIYFLLLLLVCSGIVSGQQVPSYYNDVNLNLSGQSLKNELAAKVTSTHTSNLSYTPGVWDALKITDLDPANSSRVILIYGFSDSDGISSTDRTRGVNDNGGGSTDWNREHVYPKSLGNPNLGTSGPGADAHHLRPADVSRNSSRGSRKFADGNGNSGVTGNGYWYPGDEFKGDVARMMMYMYIRYGSRCLPVNVGVGSSPSSDGNMLNLFLEWNAEDPVSALELQRNPVLENLQGNRNPFIDNPAFATEIWGGPQAEDRFGGNAGGPGGNTCAENVSSFPFTEGFESGISSWTQSSSDDFDWSVRSGSTPSSNTGPSSAYSGSQYIYMESSSPNYSAKSAIITSPCLDLSGKSSADLTFNYHMYGSSAMGSLTVEASTDGSAWTTVWSRSGNQGNQWGAATVDLSAFAGSSNLQLRFNGTTGTTWQGDMAVDNLAVTTGGSSGGSPDVPVTLTIILDNYPEETSWEVRNSGNSIVESGGTYGDRADGSQVTVNMTLAQGCYDLIFRDSYGDGICCSYGSGSYRLEQNSNGTILASGGQFGTTDSKSFCLGGATRSDDSVADQNITEPVRSRLAFYPNPAHDYVLVTNSKDVYYQIVSQAGKIIRSGAVEGEIDISGLKAGIYFISLSDGNVRYVDKLVKK